jgi:drug/metabolite transporter (DMT)-like permease
MRWTDFAFSRTLIAFSATSYFYLDTQMDTSFAIGFASLACLGAAVFFAASNIVCKMIERETSKEKTRVEFLAAVLTSGLQGVGAIGAKYKLDEHQRHGPQQ